MEPYSRNIGIDSKNSMCPSRSLSFSLSLSIVCSKEEEENINFFTHTTECECNELLRQKLINTITCDLFAHWQPVLIRFAHQSDN